MIKKCPVEDFSLKDFDESKKKIVLIGYPNVGKTTLFNHLCTKKAKVVNYPGSTFNLNLANLKEYVIVDSPGTRSLTADSLDEEITLQALNDADMAVLVLNGTRLSTQLTLFYDLLKKKIPLAIVITRADVVGEKVNIDKLKQTLKQDIHFIDAKHTQITLADLIQSAKIPDFELPQSLEEFKKQIMFAIDNHSLALDYQTYDLQTQSNSATISQIRPKELKGFDLDSIFLHPFIGPVAFVGVMSLFFYCIYTLATPLIDLVDLFFVSSSTFFHQITFNHWTSDLLIDGLWTGIGSVLVFTPQILILFFAIGILEQSGYLVRAAMIVDRPLSKIGLNGRSFVPLLSGCACAIPALLATRNIQDKKVRLVCQFVIPLMQCSARLPVYGLLLGILFINQPWMSGLGLTLIYLTSFFVAAIVAGITSKILKLADADNTFQLELPSWKKPDLGLILMQSFRQTNHFIKRAGPIIAILSIVIWIASTYPEPNNSFAMALGQILEPVFLPMGVDWRVGVALLLSFVAREVFVSVLAIMFTINSDVPTDMVFAIANATFENSGELIFTTATSIGLVVFFMISMQCMATLATARGEMGGWKVPLIQFVTYVSLAYILAVSIQQIALLWF